MSNERSFFLLRLLLVQGFLFLSHGLEIKPFHFPDNLREGMRTVVVCVIAVGDPPFDFEWSKDGRPLTTDHKGIEIKPFHFTDNLREGQRTSVMCEVLDGDPPFDFEWPTNQTLSFLRRSSRRYEDCGYVCGRSR
ncbi:hypothetical protein JTE90_026180 [Oedothorax gibbosus]|uniref:Ig-like domain-containing protein n=1 Tax=Oedothorax gibbosus TaxID=931172 RepID=A0AAV6UFF4_9ARAC|nr:hypothetical protein JTE90_026180 [Oedothorax gibbosus]